MRRKEVRAERPMAIRRPEIMFRPETVGLDCFSPCASLMWYSAQPARYP